MTKNNREVDPNDLSGIPQGFYQRAKRWDEIPQLQRLMHIHVPKTGGTYTQHVLEHVGVMRTDKLIPDGFHDGVPLFLRGRHPINFGYHIHANGHPVRLHWIAGEAPRLGLFEHALRFSLVRNPFDYLVSFYHNNTNNDTPDFDAFNVTGYGTEIPYGFGGCNYIHGCRSFRDFILRYTDPNFPFHDGQFERFMFYHYFRGYEAAILPPPFNIAGIPEVYFIIRYEHLEKGLFHLLRAAGVIESYDEMILPPDPHADKEGGRDRISALRKKRHYKEFYDDDLRERVERHCARELRMFGYDFDGPTDDRVIIDTEIDLNPKSNRIFYDDNWDVAKLNGQTLDLDYEGSCVVTQPKGGYDDAVRGGKLY